MSLPNRFDGVCRYCGNTVRAHTGLREFDALLNKHMVWHPLCAPSAGEVKPDVPPKVEAPEAPVAEEAKEPTLQELQAAADGVVQRTTDKFLALVPDLVKQTVETLVPRELVISIGKAPKVTIDRHHAALPDILLAIVAGGSPFLVGPAGSGKTTLGEQIAKVLGRRFYMTSQVTSEYKLLGFMDAQGKYVRTTFRDAYEKGGVFLFDELDASSPNVMTAVNAALANQFCDFPDGLIKRHKDFVFIAAGNTYGRGADRQYVGRNQLDGATLDRFQVFEIEYDESLELQLAGNDEWTKWVQRVRKAVEVEKIRHIVSPRASMAGAKFLAAGMDRAKVEEVCVWKGLDPTQRTRITHRMGVL